MRRTIALLLLAALASAYLIANSKVGSKFVPETVPRSRWPIDIRVDSEPVSGVADPLAVTQDLMNRWNDIAEALDPFGTARLGGAFNAGNVGQAFGVFPNTQYEVAFDDDGQIMSSFGIGAGVLGITLKSLDIDRGQLLDFLVVVNTQPIALVGPATPEELMRATLLHELGHALGLGHSPVGMSNTASFGLAPAAPEQIATMFPFRLPVRPQAGGSLTQDDVSAMIRSYPGAVTGLGSISGTVRGAGGAPVNEIAVRAIGPLGANEQHVGVLSNEDAGNQGRFRIENLPPGDYRVLIETVNGRGRVNAAALAANNNALGANPFLFAADEFWQPGDSFDPAGDDPADSAVVRVRAGLDTGSVDFVLNGRPIFQGQLLNGSFTGADNRVPDAVGQFHFADYFVFQGSAGQVATIQATSASVGTQLRLLRPTDLAQEAADLPLFGTGSTISKSLSQSGIYTVLVFARAATTSGAGSGNYSLMLSGAGSGLPPPPAPTLASIQTGPSDPGDRQFRSPVCFVPVLQLRVRAPSHEQLWVDQMIVRASGSGDDAADVTRVSLVQDRNGDGARQGDEPVLASGTFGQDNGSVALDLGGLALAAGSLQDWLLVYDVDVQSVGSAGGAGAWWLLPLALLLLIKPRRAVLLLVLLILPVACGGGSGGSSNCNRAFDPAGAVVRFRPRIDPGDILAFRATGGGLPVALVTSTLQSGTLSVSN